jgi:hypothetical protein
LIGTSLIIEGLHVHIPKGYIYFAMAFSVFVEMLNLRIRRPRVTPVQFHQPYVAEVHSGNTPRGNAPRGNVPRGNAPRSNTPRHPKRRR